MTLLTDTLVALLWVGGAILLVLGVHWAARRYMPPLTPPFRTPPGAFERLLETDIGATPVISRTEVERRAAQYRGTRP